MKKIMLSLVFSALSACATPAARYISPADVSDQTRIQDLSVCTDQMDHSSAARSRIMVGSLLLGIVGQRVAERQILDACMEEKGYTVLYPREICGTDPLNQCGPSTPSAGAYSAENPGGHKP